ncbi:PRC-barrel domain-containing protein [Nocardia brevicatena]|uniref:PRC-barrel domain-containing protein n=1 Tax=Nocardia brevicatena TaxID=37327 RepID=UPI0002E554ED|nr:PRC-barrel domain-containing protein [Nocardia brevicatena]
MGRQVEQLIGDAVYDSDGDKIGKVRRVYVDNASGLPTWAAVSTGLFSDDSLAPLAGARMRGNNADELQVRVRKDTVEAAPHLEGDGLITPEAEDELFVHYGIDPRYAGWDDYDATPAG